MLGPAFFLAGDSFPQDSYIETAIRSRIGEAFSGWTGQQDMLGTDCPSKEWMTISTRLSLLEEVTRSHQDLNRSVCFGRSFGARIATIAASRKPFGAVVCLGYPFRHPQRGLEPDRFVHLERLAVPTLILQGLRDEYGATNVIADYPLSTNIKVELLDADHGLRIPPHAWDAAATLILDFCRDALQRINATDSGGHPAAPGGAGEQATGR